MSDQCACRLDVQRRGQDTGQGAFGDCGSRLLFCHLGFEHENVMVLFRLDE